MFEPGYKERPSNQVERGFVVPHHCCCLEGLLGPFALLLMVAPKNYLINLTSFFVECVPVLAGERDNDNAPAPISRH